MVWYFIWPAPHPKYVHPPGTTIIFFHLRVFHDFDQKFSRPPVCLMGAYTGPTFSERRTKYPNCVLMQFGAKKNFENFTPKFKGKSDYMAILGPIFKRKKSFFYLLWDIIQASQEMLRGPKNTFKTIFDLGTSMGLVEAQKSSGHKNRVFLGRNF